MKSPLYECMEPIGTTGFIATRVESAAAEVEDFDRVVHTYWPRIFRFILASVRDRDAAQTLTQDCFWNAYRSRKNFRGDSSVNTWLMRIAVNAVNKFARNRRLQFWRKAEQSSVDAATLGELLPDRRVSPETMARVNEQVEAVWAATRSLSGRQRTVFLLRFMEDMTILEIALVTGLSENAAQVHLFRAIRAVRKLLGRPL